MAAASKKSVNGAARAREQIEVKNPVTGELIGAVPVHADEDVREAVTRARTAQRAWGMLEVRDRCRILRRWGDLIWQDQKAIIRTIREETGKNDAGAFLEVLALDAVTNYYVHKSPEILRARKRRTLFPFVERARVYYKPYGVVGFISPWNYPMLLSMMDMVAALAAGSAVILKPSEGTPFTALHAVDLMHRAGVPDDVAQVVTGAGSTGAALVDHVDYISFTGSTLNGRKVAVRAAERLIPFCLELGGKDPMIVLKDADLDLAATGALRGALENAGQACISTERVYVEDAIYDQFVERIAYYTDQLAVGPGDGFDVHMGSMTNERELLRAEANVRDAVERGAQILHGGKRRPYLGPLFYEPTVLLNVDHSMAVMRDETFGPVVPIMRVADADEAIRLANDSSYGLSASIFTRDLARGEALARQINSGDVCINRTHVAIGTPALPTGGQKESGIGRRNGPEGLLRFVTTQAILVDNQLGQKPELTLADPRTVSVVLLMRRLRRFLPFLN